MEQIIITHTDGSTMPLQSRGNVSIVSKATQKVALLSDDLLSLTVMAARPLSFQLGDKITVFGRDYKLNQLPQITKESERKYTYELQLEGVQYDLLDVNFILPDDTYGDTLYTDLKGYCDALIWNIDRIFPGHWSIGQVPEGTATKNLSVAGKNCLAVIQELCEEYDVEFEMAIDTAKLQQKGANNYYILSFKAKTGTTHPFTLQYGRGLGLYKLVRQNVNNSSVVTRLYAYGGTDNLGNRYKESKLHLPAKSRTTSYIEDEDAIQTYGVKEGEKTYSDIYPARVGTITEVGTDVITFKDSSMFDLNKKESDGSTTYLIDGTTAKITFQSGNLAGYSFDVHSYDDATKTFVINKFTDENGMVFPSDTSEAFQFKRGDTYIIEDITLPQEYIDEAEKKLLEQATKDFETMKQPQVSYKLTFDEIYFIRLWGRDTDTEVLHPGDYIKVVDEQVGINKEVRITRIERNLLKKHSYDITLSDTVTKSTTVRVLNDLQDLTDSVINSGMADPTKARRNWKTAQEVLAMVFDPDGDYYSEKIKPLSIETTMLSVGAKSQQFVLRNVVIQPNVGGNYNTILFSAGYLVHYGFDEIQTWRIAQNTTTLYADTPYYIYVKCSRTDNSASWYVADEAIKAEQYAGYYHFLVGVLNSPDYKDGRKARSVSLTYGFSTINGRFIKTGRIESTAGSCYFDLDNNEIGGVIKFTKSDGTTGDVSDVSDKADEAKDYINNTLPGILSGLQEQVDGQIEQYFYETDPTPISATDQTQSGEPNATWEANGEQEKHVGDLYYNTATGNVWRYVNNAKVTDNASGINVYKKVYYWSQLADDAAAAALKAAQDAQQTANSKRRIFTTTPYTPYDVGDLWVQGATGDILRCIKARETGNYTASDWEKASKYTDNSALNTFINGQFANIVSSLTKQIDGKIESYFQSSDPSVDWDDDEKPAHVGDMWYNTSTKRLYRYQLSSDGTTYGWDEVQNADALAAYQAASNAQDTADGKRRVFVAQPYAPYDVGDLWLTGDSTNGKLKRCITARKKGESFKDADWVEAVYYDNTQTTIDGGIVTAGTVQLANGNTQSIVAGITGGEEEASDTAEEKKVRFWAGSSKENRFTAPFRVLQDGSFVASKGKITGEINATSGKIGGFDIAQGRIGADQDVSNTANRGISIYRDEVIISGSGTFAAMGNNVLPASTGAVAVGRFENNISNPYMTNWGVIINVSGAAHNIGLYTNSAIISKTFAVGIGFTVETPAKNTCNIIGDATSPNPFLIMAKYIYDNSAIGLPTRYSVASILGIGTSTTFAVKFSVICHASSTKRGYIYGRNSSIKGMSGTQYPLIKDNNAGDLTGSIAQERGDIDEFMLVYDGSQYYAYWMTHMN